MTPRHVRSAIVPAYHDRKQYKFLSKHWGGGRIIIIIIIKQEGKNRPSSKILLCTSLRIKLLCSRQIAIGMKTTCEMWLHLGDLFNNYLFYFHFAGTELLLGEVLKRNGSNNKRRCLIMSWHDSWCFKNLFSIYASERFGPQLFIHTVVLHESSKELRDISLPDASHCFVYASVLWHLVSSLFLWHHLVVVWMFL